MRITITGSHGLVGSALTLDLQRDGHEVVRLVHSETCTDAGWNPRAEFVDLKSLEGIDALVHLGGAGIADARWTRGQKELIRHSRIAGTACLVNGMRMLSDPPKAFLSASAIGYYGDRKDDLLEEDSAGGEGFLAAVCRDWESEARQAADLGIRTAILRSGVVLSNRGGMLAKLLPIFRAGFGGRLANGRQWMSWIAIADEVALIRHVIEHSTIEGPVNLTSPNPVTNIQFTQSLARNLHRPSLLSVPKRALNLAMGREATEDFILASQRVVPKVAQNSGYTFCEPDLDAAIANATGGRTDP